GTHLRAGVADDVADVVAVVDARLHDQRALPGDLGPAQPADQLLALAAEHRAADDPEPAAALGKEANHGRRSLFGALDGLEGPAGEEPQAHDPERAAVLHHRQVAEVVLEH